MATLPNEYQTVRLADLSGISYYLTVTNLLLFSLMPVWSAARIVVVVCIILIFFLGVTYGQLENWGMSPSQPRYSLNLDRNLTYTNGSLSIVVGNNGNSTGKVLNVYGVGNKNQSTTIFSSLLATQTGKIIQNLTFGANRTYKIQNNNAFPVAIKPVEPKGLRSGIYHGFLYLRSEKLATVPITVSTEPKVAQATIIVVVGVLASILFWEVFFFLNRIMNTRSNNLLRAEADNSQIQAADAQNQADNSQNQAADAQNQAAALQAQAQALDVDNPQVAALNREIADLNEQATALTEDATALTEEATASTRRSTKYRTKARHREVRASSVKNRYLINTTKIVSAEIGSVAFGILTGIIGLANNTYVTNLVEINSIDSVILLGIGLGIGSLKGFVDR